MPVTKRAKYSDGISIINRYDGYTTSVDQASKPFQTESTEAKGDKELVDLFLVLKTKAEAGSIMGKPDLTLMTNLG